LVLPFFSRHLPVTRFSIQGGVSFCSPWGKKRFLHLAGIVRYDGLRPTIDLEQFLMNQLLKLFIAANILTMGFCSSAKETPNPLMASSSVVWAGLDYSLMRMIGETSTEYGFKYPNLIFPTMLNSWNQLFLDERIERIAKKMDKDVIVDIGGVTERNKVATAKQIILSPGPQDGIEESHITPQDITAEVQSFKLDQTNGLGLVFIIDRFVHEYHPAQASGGQGKAAAAYSSDRAAIYLVFFDVATRNVISAKRGVYGTGGGSFRNYWFRPVKIAADNDLSQYKTSVKKYRKAALSRPY